MVNTIQDTSSRQEVPVEIEKNGSFDAEIPSTASVRHGDFCDSNEEIILVDGGYGWVCVAAVFLINAHTWGINTAYSVFLAEYLSGNNLGGANVLNFAFIGGCLWGVPLLISPIAVLCIRAFGIRTCLLIGTVLQCGSLIGASFADQTWQLFLSQGIGFALGVGFFLVSTQNIIIQWFSKHRGLAVGMGVSGTGVGSVCYSLASGRLIESLGTNMALRILAIIAGSVTLVCSLLIRDRNNQIQPRFLFFEVKFLRQPRFILLCGYAIFNMLGEIIILTQLPSYGHLIAELSPSQGSVIGAMIGVGQIVGRLGIGYACDSLGRIGVPAIAALLAGLLSLLVWPFANSFGLLIFFSISVGGFAGSFWATVGPMTAEIMGLKNLPTALSMLFLILAIPCIFSPVIGLELVEDYNKSYLNTQLFSGITYVISAVFGWLLRTYNVEAHRMNERRSDYLPHEENPTLISDSGVVIFSRSFITAIFRLNS